MVLTVSIYAFAVVRTWAEVPAERCTALCLTDVDCDLVDDCGVL